MTIVQYNYCIEHRQLQSIKQSLGISHHATVEEEN